MATDFILSTTQNNNFSIPVNIPSGWTSTVTFRNATAPVNSISNGILYISIPSSEALKYSGIDFFVTITNNGITQRIFHGEFASVTVPDKIAKISDVTKAVAQGNSGVTDNSFVATDAIIYGANGEVLSITEGGVVTTYTYNSNGTVNTETRNGKVRTWSYDSNGNPVSSTIN